MNRVCAFCKAKPKTLPLLQCSRCKKVIYCNRDCQRGDWKVHKLVCIPVTEQPVLKTLKKEAEAEKIDEVEMEKEIEEAEKLGEEDFAPLLGDFMDEEDFIRPAPIKIDKRTQDYGAGLKRELTMIKKYSMLSEKHGAENKNTLRVSFELIHMWLNCYKLTPCSELIEEIWPACKKKFDEKTDQQWYLKALQSKAFLRFKQFRYQEAIDIFQEFRDIMGASAQLCENMGHTYNRLGEYESAEKAFKEALDLIDDPKLGKGANKGGILLGFGSMLQKMKKSEQALAVHTSALTFYQEHYKNVAHSLVAKALVAVGGTLDSLQRYPEAVAKFEEAVSIYTQTVGEQTPLTANAVGCLGSSLLKDGQFEKARKELARSFTLYVSFDTLDLIRILDILKLIMETHSKIGSGIDQSCYKSYIPGVSQLVANLKHQNIEEDGTGTVSVLLKTAAELAILGGEYTLTRPMLVNSKTYFETVTFLDCSNLVSTCDKLIQFIDAKK